jgi:hypothetical protein
MAPVWAYSIQALAILSGLPDLIARHVVGVGHVVVVRHLSDVVLLIVFVRLDGGIDDRAICKF